MEAEFLVREREMTHSCFSESHIQVVCVLTRWCFPDHGYTLARSLNEHSHFSTTSPLFSMHIVALQEDVPSSNFSSRRTNIAVSEAT